MRVQITNHIFHSKVCMRLLSVFEKGDMDGLREVVQTQIFDFIHPSVGRVARQLPDEVAFTLPCYEGFDYMYIKSHL